MMMSKFDKFQLVHQTCERKMAFASYITPEGLKVKVINDPTTSECQLNSSAQHKSDLCGSIFKDFCCSKIELPTLAVVCLVRPIKLQLSFIYCILYMYYC